MRKYSFTEYINSILFWVVLAGVSAYFGASQDATLYVLTVIFAFGAAKSMVGAIRMRPHYDDKVNQMHAKRAILLGVAFFGSSLWALQYYESDSFVYSFLQGSAIFGIVVVAIAMTVIDMTEQRGQDRIDYDDAAGEPVHVMYVPRRR